VNEVAKFFAEVQKNIATQGGDHALKELSLIWLKETVPHKYSYNFTWLGRPIIQYPQDIIAMQEIIWAVKPALIIETGIAHGGSLVFYASILELIGGCGQVLAVDIDIREHNRREIEKHAMSKRITMIGGSSDDKAIAEEVYAFAQNKTPVMVVLDSNHTHEHVRKELELYSPLVTRESYMVVCDTVIEDMPREFFPDRPWGKGNNPKTAVWEFLQKNDRFVVDKDLESKLLITVSPDGYLKCVKD
jgi:cephalosporin hydroxylase